MLSSGVFPGFSSSGGDSQIVLLMIDPQVDFHEGGSLPVQGATADAQRISEMIIREAQNISQIFVTMDSHNRNHIAHASFWFTEKPGPMRVKKAPIKTFATSGDLYEPVPFSLIESKDIGKGKWEPVDQSLMEHCINYTAALEEKGRFKLCIWPEHCLVGTPGHCVQADIFKASQIWTKISKKTIHYVYKGNNNLTEMYSAICAEVPVEADPSTQTNYMLLDYFRKSSKVVVCGQACSHCVNFTVRDIVADWIKRGKDLKRLVILQDAMSSVGGFEADGIAFLEEMASLGVTLSTTQDPAIFSNVDD